MKQLKRLGLGLAHLVAGVGRLGLLLLTLLALIVWALGTRGVPLVVEVSQKWLGGELQIAHAEGGLFGPILLNGIVLETPSAHIEIDHVYLVWSPGALWRRTLQVDRLAIGQITVQRKAREARPPQPLRPKLPRDLVVSEFSVARFEQRPIEGAPLLITAIRGSGSWRNETVVIDALQFAHAQTGLVQASAQVALAPTAITVQQLNLSGPARLSASGSLGLMGESSALTATVQDAQWPLQGVATVRVPELTVTARGVLTDGPLDAALTLQGALRTAVDDKPLGFDLDGALRLQPHGLHIERLQLVSRNGGGSLLAQGDAVWQPALGVEAVVELRKLNPGVLLPDWKGQLNGRFEAHTQRVKGVPQVRFTAALKDSTLRGYPLQLDLRGLAALQGETQQLQIDALTLTSGGARLTAAGKLLPRLDARLTLAAADLKAVLPSLSGAVQLAVELQGLPGAPAVQAQGSLHNFRSKTLSVASGALALDYTPTGQSKAELQLSGVQDGDTQLSSASLIAEGRIERHSIQLRAQLAQPKATVSLSLAGAAKLQTRSWQGSLQQSALTLPYGPGWQQEAPGALLINATQQRLEPTCWRAGQARVCLDATLAPPVSRIAYRIEQLDTAAFAALLPKGWLLQTIVDGRGQVALNGSVPETLNLELQLGAGRVSLPDAPTLQLLPSTLSVRQSGGVWLAKADLALDRGTLAFEASTPVAGGVLLERPLSGRVRLALPDIAWLTPLVPGVQDLRGALAGAFNIAGSVGTPQLQGALNLTGGSARIPAAGIVLKDILAEARGGNSGPLALTASASSGGPIQLSGSADFANGKPVVQLKITGDQVQIADIADARIWVSPNLVYAQNAEGMSLTGTVTVPKADITPRKLAANAVGASSDQVLVGAEAPEKKSLPLTTKVTVVMGEAVSFEGFGLKSKLRGSVTAVDTPGSGGTRGFGELRLIDAAYKAYGQEIAVETGRILFNGGPIAEPTVDIVARRSPREDVSVSLRVRGTLEQPTFDLSSSPAMPREQQLGWLIFGRPIDGGASGEFSGAAAALSLGIAGGDALASRLGKIVGLDQVSLEADTSSNAWQASGSKPGQAGTDQTRFTVGKYLSPKLFVSYGVGLFDNGNVLRLLYDLGRGFKLRTEAGLETGGDLLYSVEH